MKLAFLGIGLMGAPMVRNLVLAGFDVTIWNRSPEKAEALTGVSIASTPGEAGANANIVITMLRDGPVTEQVAVKSGLLEAMKPGALMIDMASIPPDTARKHGALAAAKKIGYLDAPVSGGTPGAMAASLTIMAGGTGEDFARAARIFETLGRATHVGPVGTGQLVKLANQAIVAINIGAVAEAMILCRKSGADPAAMRQALMGGHGESRVLREHGQRMIERNFEPGGKAAIHLKDLNTAVCEAGKLDLDLPITNLLQSLFCRLCEEKNGETLDHSALLLHLESLNAIDDRQAPGSS